MTRDELIAFEDEIRELFNNGKIAAPVHLAGGNEDQLIEIFKEVRPQDWVIGSWRSHYHCLLKGVPPDELKQKIIDGRSIALCFPEQKILCTALVGGSAPLAVGIAWAIKQKNLDESVWCFLGDMTSQTGIVHEAMQYSEGHNLKVKWVIEDNGISVGADTLKTWGRRWRYVESRHYEYTINVPHVGRGRWSGL